MQGVHQLESSFGWYGRIQCAAGFSASKCVMANAIFWVSVSLVSNRNRAFRALIKAFTRSWVFLDPLNLGGSPGRMARRGATSARGAGTTRDCTATAGIDFNSEREFRVWAGKRKKVGKAPVMVRAARTA